MGSKDGSLHTAMSNNINAYTKKDKYGKESKMNKVPWECGDVQMETLAAVRGKAGDRREEKRSGC